MNNPNGFQTRVWGPAAWLFLHCITLNYNPARHRKEYIAFFKMLAYVLPCKACRDNYKNTITNHKDELRLTDKVFKSRRTLSMWLFKLHNYVTRCQLKSRRLEYTDTPTDFMKMVGMYEQFRAKCTTSSSKNNNRPQHTGGCTRPLKGGVRMHTVIQIKPFCNDSRKRSSIRVFKRPSVP